jgi:pilus assembly protein CpaB
MSTKSLKRPTALGTVVFMGGAVVFAALSGLLLSQLLENKYSQEPVRPLVVAKRDLPAGEPLRAEDLKRVDWPQSSVPKGAFSTVEAVIKCKSVPLVPVVEGEVMLRSHLSQPNTGVGVTTLIERGKRAFSIKTDDPVTVAKLVYPGARVDVLTTVQRYAQKRGTHMVTRTVLQNVKVLAVGEDIDPMTVAKRRTQKREEDGDRAFSDNQSDSREARGVLTLLVNPREAEQLSRAAREGKIDIALRNPRDTSVTAVAQQVQQKALQPEAEEAEWGLAVSRKPAETEKKRSRTRRRRSRKRALIAAGSPTPTIRIFRGGK